MRRGKWRARKLRNTGCCMERKCGDPKVDFRKQLDRVRQKGLLVWITYKDGSKGKFSWNTDKKNLLLTGNLWLCQIEGEKAFIYSLEQQKTGICGEQKEEAALRRRVQPCACEFWWMKSSVTFLGPVHGVLPACMGAVSGHILEHGSSLWKRWLVKNGNIAKARKGVNFKNGCGLHV